MTKQKTAKGSQESATQKAYCFPELGITVYASSLSEAQKRIESDSQ